MTFGHKCKLIEIIRHINIEGKEVFQAEGTRGPNTNRGNKIACPRNKVASADGAGHQRGH